MNTTARLPTGRTRSGFPGCDGSNRQRPLNERHLLDFKTRKGKGYLGQDHHLEAKSEETGFLFFTNESRNS
jgi:hypothetical protein